MDELAEFYRRMGAALWYVQHLENVLVNFLTVKEIHERRCAGKDTAPTGAWELLAAHRKQTLGPLIESCKHRRIIKKSDAARFEALKNERHWLVHRSLVDNGDDLYLEPKRTEVFHRIAAIEEHASALRDSVAADLQSWASSHGVDVDAAEEVARRDIAALKGL